ncbi:hypothetical protein JKF63_04079 [Porcisia hertigi]|uniref:Uncharacterized protein n=1 Tax=Porcisia hertigi TaxID=2761500 RepID=A0A836IDQ5_9TRYP|nr:hypothetical protein JKF63_04079 [Porcisia hertigi]
MDPTLCNGVSLSQAENAPFSYRRRRRSVWESAQHVEDAARATDAAIGGDHVAHAQSGHVSKSSIRANGVLGTMPSVLERACRYSCAEAKAERSSRSTPKAPLLSSSPNSKLVPPLTIDPVPSHLRLLSYVRSTRAWDAIAAGCAAEARLLSETDSDVVAWAASFIIGGEPHQGLFMLESYVIATCVVLHEQREGGLSRSSYLERHNNVMLDWMRHRTQLLAGVSSPPLHCDVDPLQVSEAVVRHVVLQSMQLMDHVEVHRWYTLALAMCTSQETHYDGPDNRGDPSSKGSSGDKAITSSRNSDNSGCVRTSLKLSPRDGQDSFKAQDFRDFRAVPPKTPPTDTSAALASEGYETPLNLWFRYFFALCETTSADGLLAATLPAQHTPPSKTDDRHAIPTILRATASTARVSPLTVKGDSGSSTLRKHERGGSFCCSAPLSSLRTAPAWATTALRDLDEEETAALLLSHCEEWEVFFITAVAAFYTQHYRTCMIAASRFLHWAESNGAMRRSVEASYHHEGRKGTSEDARSQTRSRPTHCSAQRHALLPAAAGAPGFQDYQCRLALFVRAWSSLLVGERLQFGKDVEALLDYAEDSLSYHIGCALALYGLPLPAAKETVMSATAHFTCAGATVTPLGVRAGPVDGVSPILQAYLYVLTESVHALMLLQIGMVESAMEVAKAALDRTKVRRALLNRAVNINRAEDLLLGTLHDLVVITATALEDATSVLEVPLTPHHLAYIAVCRAFFGGLCAGGIRVKPHSEAHRLLYPLNLPLYASTRQMIPFHMNRATYLYHNGQLRGAWDDVCCAVAAADEVVGSVEFAFSDCFPLRVYYFACYVGFALIEDILCADLEAARSCLSNPDNQEAVDQKDATLQENEILSKEVIHICGEVVQRMLYFYPHSRLTELCQVRLAVMCEDKGFLNQAVLLSNRYPHSPAAQNLLTLAIYFDNRVPEAVDNADKNLQVFPHSREVIRIHRMLHTQKAVYRFNYRGVLPVRYKPGPTGRVVTKRVVFMILLLVANLVVLGLTAYANTPYAANLSEEMKQLAVRVQLPSTFPLVFVVIFLTHAIVAAATTQNLISTTLTDLFFVNSALNRAFFCLRCIPFINLVNALLISFAGNNFLFEHGYTTFMLYAFLSLLFVPFTTRVWLLPSVDEPDVDVMTWLAILSVDTVIAFVVTVPHLILAVLEPCMFILFYFYTPTPRPDSEASEFPPSNSIRRRLLLHSVCIHTMPPRFVVGSGSRFLPIRLLKCLYYRSHSSMETRYLAESQLEAESYRVFPMIEGEEARAIVSHVPQAPICAALTGTELEPSSGSPAPRSGATAVPLNHDNATKDHSTLNANDSVGSQRVAPMEPQSASTPCSSASSDGMVLPRERLFP